jgi:hypothetical protein
MDRNFDFDVLKEGIVTVDQRKESQRLVEKWARTGLLDGLSERGAHAMARLMENQAASMLNEATTTSDIIGFQNVAFPIVRRVFGGLIANELVSVQPMSLPSGLLFYLDYRYDTVKGGNKNDDFTAGGSLFGNRNSLQDAAATGGLYNLGTSFSQREKVSATSLSGSTAAATLADINNDPELSASLGSLKVLTVTNGYSTLSALSDALVDVAALKLTVPVTGASTSVGASTDGTPVQLGTYVVYRRHTVRSGNDIKYVVAGAEGTAGSDNRYIKLSYVTGPTLSGGTSGTLAISGFESDLAATPTPVIPELDLRIQSVSVTAQTRKLKAKWTPEVAQDMAAYQNLDAEVELTQVLSEAIALEIDREILADLLYNATGANFYWSRKPGNFLDKTTGTAATGASFTGTVREWYETLIETIIDVANNIHRKTLRGAANFLVTSPDVATILEASVLYKPVLSMDPKETMLTVGAEKAGTLNSRFTVYKDPYFIRNRILVGYKGGAFLETGYVYAPYVPLIVTPTIYAPEDLTPRKGVMTRYAKQLVRSDFYGTVTVLDMNVI